MPLSGRKYEDKHVRCATELSIVRGDGEEVGVDSFYVRTMGFRQHSLQRGEPLAVTFEGVQLWGRVRTMDHKVERR